ncbi:hypothetical protein LINPERPRIM_LOCUS38957 [Linum perenne]
MIFVGDLSRSDLTAEVIPRVERKIASEESAAAEVVVERRRSKIFLFCNSPSIPSPNRRSSPTQSSPQLLRRSPSSPSSTLTVPRQRWFDRCRPQRWSPVTLDRSSGRSLYRDGGVRGKEDSSRAAGGRDKRYNGGESRFEGFPI